MFWRHIRLAGAVLSLASVVFKNLNLALIGIMMIAVGVVNGMFWLEEELKKLKEGKE